MSARAGCQAWARDERLRRTLYEYVAWDSHDGTTHKGLVTEVNMRNRSVQVNGQWVRAELVRPAPAGIGR